MFKIEQKPTYTGRVEVFSPRDGGKYQKGTFTAEFKALAQEEIDSILGDLRDGRPDSDFALECLVGWKGVQDEDGNELPFSDSTRDQVLDIYPVLPSVIKAFYESLSGARAKN